MKLRIAAVAVMVSALLSVVIAWLMGSPPLARLAYAQGTVDRDVRGHEEQWSSAQQGDSFSLGDGLRTAPNSQARLVLARGTVLQVDENTTLRLLSSAPGEESFRILKGSAEVEAGEAELSIETSAGKMRVPRKGRVSVRESKGDTWVRVDMGKAELGWSKQPLLRGEELSTIHGAAQPERAPAPEATQKVLPAPEVQEPAPPVQEGVSARVTGKEVRVRKQGEQSAQQIAEGEHILPVGSHVTVEDKSSIELVQGEGGRLLTDGHAELVVGDGRAHATRVMSGKLRARAGSVPVELEVPGGRIVLRVDDQGGASATVRVSKQDTQVNVERGSVSLRGAGSEQTLGAGAHGELKQSEARKVDESALPALSDFTLVSGSSPLVHDPNPPSAITFAVGDKCQGKTAMLEQSVRGRFELRDAHGERLRAWFPAGTTSYRVRCQLEGGAPGKIVLSGRITVQRDAAERQVTKRAPEVDVDLDGRKYTAVYQTLLPRVTVHAGEGSGQFKLRVDSAGAQRTFAGSGGLLVFESGTLREGEHTLQREGATASEKPTRLVIRFDNAAPAAYVESAQGVTRNADGSFTLRGGALPGSEVTAEGVRVPLAKDGRFETEVRLAPGARGFGLWIKHPRVGSHYYVRRVEGGAP